MDDAEAGGTSECCYAASLHRNGGSFDTRAALPPRPSWRTIADFNNRKVAAPTARAGTTEKRSEEKRDNADPLVLPTVASIKTYFSRRRAHSTCARGFQSSRIFTFSSLSSLCVAELTNWERAKR